MDMGLKGKVAIVTGAGRGLGQAIAIMLAAEGAQVVVAARRIKEGEETVGMIRKAGSEAIFVRTDVSKAAEVEALIDEVFRRFGRIDILVNNAGVGLPGGPWADLTEDVFYNMVDINLKGVYLCSKAVTPHMINQQSGKIINIGSSAAKTAEKFGGIYSASKAAVVNLTQSMAFELAEYKINVNAVCPAAMMDSDMMEKACREWSESLGVTVEEVREKLKSRFPWPIELTAQDVANLVIFLTSDNAALITGQAINVSGGSEVH